MTGSGTVQLVRVEHRGNVGVVTLADAARRNVLSASMVEAIGAAVDELEAAPEITVMVLTGDGSAFCAGALLSTLESAAEGDFTGIENVYAGFLRVFRSSLVTIAAVNGPAVGAGFNLALACDLRLAGTGAVFESRFPRLRIFPGGGHTFLLTRAVGYQQALAACLLGEVWDAAAAVRNGLVLDVVAGAELVDHAVTLGSRLGSQDPEYVARLLEVLRGSTSLAGHEESLALEAHWQEWSTRQPAFRSGLEEIVAAVSRRQELT